MEFTHFDTDGNAWMVDVGGKEETSREAVARGSIFMSRECFENLMIHSNTPVFLHCYLCLYFYFSFL